MSYILDALKRADAERERGHVPGLHAQPQPAPSSTAASVGLPRWALATGAAVSLLLVAALAWRMGADTVAPVPATLAMPDPGTAPQPTTAPPAQVPAERPADEPVALAPVPVPPAAPATTTTRPAPAAPAAVKPSPALPRPAQPAPQKPAAAPINTNPNAANATLPLYAQLPAALRQQLPTLVVTGSVYSEDAGARFVMLNGDVAKEGSQPAPGLVVERIEPKSAVLRYKGERFRLPY